MSWIYCVECGDPTENPVYSTDEPHRKFCSNHCLDVWTEKQGFCHCPEGPKLGGRMHWEMPRCGTCFKFPHPIVISNLRRHEQLLSEYVEHL